MTGAVVRPGNYEVRIGTPLRDLLAAAGGALPADWRDLSRIADLSAWADFLNRADATPQLIADARRMIERGVRFVQTWHGNLQPWDSHSNIREEHRKVANECDQGLGALITDLKQRGMLDDTLVIWGGEFGRTVYCQGTLTETNYGRDHHPRCFSLWLAGAGIKGGTVYGETDEMSYNVVRDPVHVRDLHATILHLMGLDHERLTYFYQGLEQRITGVRGEVIRRALA